MHVHGASVKFGASAKSKASARVDTQCFWFLEAGKKRFFFHSSCDGAYYEFFPTVLLAELSGNVAEYFLTLEEKF